MMTGRVDTTILASNRDEHETVLTSNAWNTELLIIGVRGWSHIGASLERAAARLGIRTILFDSARAFRAPRVLQSISWRFGGHRPFKLNRFGEEVVTWCNRTASSSRAVIGTGAAPLTAAALIQLKAAGVFCINYSTDDPWNPNHLAKWHLSALKCCDLVFTPRRSNIEDFRNLGCADVRYLPFAYDEGLFSPSAPLATVPSHDVLFVGGADRDRAAFMTRFMRSGLQPALVGGYWSRFTETRGCDLGHKDIETVRQLTAAAAVNICLVRRANRDGHVMRSFEIPAIGGFMLAEDTPEHRELFGVEGRCVLYFTSPEMAAEKARWALANPDERGRMSRAAHALITGGRNTYGDRLLQMLAVFNARNVV